MKENIQSLLNAPCGDQAALATAQVGWQDKVFVDVSYRQVSQFFGGTSLLILVGVVLDTLQQIESHLLMRHYDGLLKSGRIKGRTGSIAAY